MMTTGVSSVWLKWNSQRSRLETRRALDVSFMGLGGSPNLMTVFLSFFCRRPFIAKFSKDAKRCNAQSLSVKFLISYPSLFRAL